MEAAPSDNVERLSFRPLPPKTRPADLAPTAPDFDLSAVQATIATALAEHSKAAEQRALAIANHAADTAIKAALGKSNSSIIATFHAIATILAVRFILLLAVVGGFVLALLVMSNPNVIGACVLAAYVAATVWPLVWLDIGARKQAG